MPTSTEGMLLLLLSFVATFSVGRFLSRRWRRKDAERARDKMLKGETRQMRRARERREQQTR